MTNPCGRESRDSFETLKRKVTGLPTSFSAGGMNSKEVPPLILIPLDDFDTVVFCTHLQTWYWLFLSITVDILCLTSV